MLNNYIVKYNTYYNGDLVGEYTGEVLLDEEENRKNDKKR